MSNYLLKLAKTIESKKNDDVKKSYTSFLLSKGFSGCLDKFKEESQSGHEEKKNRIK